MKARFLQSYALFPHLKVRQNISFGMELRRVARKTIEERIAVAAETLNLSAYLDRYPRELPAGLISTAGTKGNIFHSF